MNTVGEATNGHENYCVWNLNHSILLIQQNNLSTVVSELPLKLGNLLDIFEKHLEICN